MRRSFEYFYFFLLLAIYFLALQLRPVFSPIEVRCAEIVREMVCSGEYFIMQLNSEIYKPGVLPGLQISALLAKLLQPSQFVLRLLSFASVSCCAWLIYFLFRTKTYSRLTAQFAVCIFLTMPAVFFIGTSVLPDMFFVLLTILSFGALYSCQEHHTRIYSAILVYLCSGVLAGFACCMKDFSGFFIPLASYTLYLITMKRKKDLLLFPAVMFIESLMILLLWNLLNPHVKYVHFLSELTAIHTRIGFHLCSFQSFLQLLSGCVIWLPVFVVSCIGLGRKLWENKMLRMTAAFFVTALCSFFFFDSSPSAIMFIILPMTVLTAAGLRSWLIRPWGKKYLCGIAVTVLVLDLIAVLLLFIGFFADYACLQIFGKHEAWQWILSIVFSGFSIVSIVFLLYEKRIWQRLRSFLLALLPLMLFMMCIYPHSVLSRSAPSAMLDGLPPFPDDTTIFTVSELMPDLCWGLKRRDIILLDSGEPAKEWERRLKDRKFGSVLLILKKSDFEKGKRYGIFPDDAVWERDWARDVPCLIVNYRFNMRDLKK